MLTAPFTAVVPYTDADGVACGTIVVCGRNSDDVLGAVGGAEQDARAHGFRPGKATFKVQAH